MTNYSISQPEIVELFVTCFSGMLKTWWEKHLALEAQDQIVHSVQQDDEGNPIFDERIGRGIPDGVNTLLYTIVKHFIGTLSNITARIHD